MSTVTVTKDNLEATLAEKPIVFLDFWAEWCSPCRNFGPIYEQASNEHPDVIFGKINTEEEQELAATAGIISIPTVMVFREGILIFKQSGALPASAISDVLSQVEKLDMDEIRAKIASEAAAASS